MLYYPKEKNQKRRPKKMKTLTVNNIGNFEFWVEMFRPRSKQWQRKTLSRLNKNVSCFETLEENQDKIKALKFLLNS